MHDSATLTGATSDAGGTVTYSVYDNVGCTGSPVANEGTKTVTNGVVPDSDADSFPDVGLLLAGELLGRREEPARHERLRERAADGHRPGRPVDLAVRLAGPGRGRQDADLHDHGD